MTKIPSLGSSASSVASSARRRSDHDRLMNAMIRRYHEKKKEAKNSREKYHQWEQDRLKSEREKIKAQRNTQVSFLIFLLKILWMKAFFVYSTRQDKYLQPCESFYKNLFFRQVGRNGCYEINLSIIYFARSLKWIEVNKIVACKRKFLNLRK